MATNVASSPPQASFRRLLPAPDRPQLAGLSSSSAREWYESRMKVPELFDFIERLEAKNLEKPYIGITSDGHVIPDLFDHTVDEGAPVAAMCEATNALLSILSVQQENDTVFPSVLDDNIRLWSNPEVYVNPGEQATNHLMVTSKLSEGGLRLDECSPAIQTAVHNILRSSMSLEGYQKVDGCCIVNKFLGELVGGSRVLNEHSYNFRLFGRPSLTQPWGYTFFGHHLCLAVVVAGGRMVIGPTFMGAEPNIIDEGPHTGLQLFTTEREGALQLLRSLPPALQTKAILSHSVLPEDLPKHRWVPYDERHIAGARQDNRVIPYVRIFIGFNLYYPERVLSHKVQMFRNHLHMTYFAWIGGHEDDDVYYFRIHSPVSLMEFDFHCGVYLTNDTPDKCHIHTINRIPNRGDYGRALVEKVQKDAIVSGQGLGLQST
ncbi:hypothetical protein FANTH_14709 [Fusarium anthophilum]|uniref:Uncharacterized protein n=1 Tax=Fusarium anthophilum TaxID=48485 RepID=A0A8H4YGU0_9HYPO|nr:hypothetical protein FANTH_14709 [Fusarium anthophilum]